MPELCVVVLDAQALAKTATVASARIVNSVFISGQNRLATNTRTCGSQENFSGWETMSRRGIFLAGSVSP